VIDVTLEKMPASSPRRERLILRTAKAAGLFK
jgi:hypothetical protein